MAQSPDRKRAPQSPKKPVVTVYDLHDLPTIAAHLEAMISSIERTLRRPGGVSPGVAVHHSAVLASFLHLVTTEAQRNRLQALLQKLQ